MGFIVAFNGEIDEHEAQSILTRLKANANSAVAAAVEEAEADIEHFVGHRRGESTQLTASPFLEENRDPQSVPGSQHHP